MYAESTEKLAEFGPLCRLRLPNPSQAVVDLRKLGEYCLSSVHPQGKHKARLFRSALGLTQVDAELLRRELLDRALTGEALLDREDEHGIRYVIDFEMAFRSRRAPVRSAWIVLRSEDFPRLVTCYVR